MSADEPQVHTLKEKLGRHLRVFAYAAIFGLGAYGVINLLIYLFRSLGSRL